MKIILLAGARPNFMKIAPVIRAMGRYNSVHSESVFQPVLVHSGQHYDYEMSRVFFEDLEIPEPDVHLNVGSGTHAGQTAGVMVEFEKALLDEKPGMVVVVGDVNSTLAGAIAAVKLHIPVAHIEAGVRSGDRSMPEEINRLLTDMISDYLFTPSAEASGNLKREGVPESRIFAVGNVMVDSLLFNKPKAERSGVLGELGLKAGAYSLLTLHRAANVDDRETLGKIAGAVSRIARDIPVVFPAHPRTRKNIEAFGMEGAFGNERIIFIKPQGYIRFLSLLMGARFVMTDSGGVEPETTVLGVPCLTLMDSTAWQETVTHGTNVLVGISAERIIEEARKIMDGRNKDRKIPPLWDGKAAERIVDVLAGGPG